MAITCLAKISPMNPATGSRVDIYVSSANDRNVTGLNGVVWEPAIISAPTLSINLWQGDFKDPVDTGGASLALHMGVLKMTYANADTYTWVGAPIEIYAEESGTAWPWAAKFKGRISGFSRRNEVLSINSAIDTEPFDKNILTATYAGTGGAEGGSDLKGRLKPLVIGWAKNVEPVLIDTVNNVYQFSGYGAIEEVSNLYERAADFGASVGDYATYAALVAATIPAGRWGTCLAAGMVRLGAPAAGVITGDLKGHKVGATTPRLSGAVISALATIAGVSTGDIETSTLTSLDAAVPYPINLVLTEQVTFRDMAAGLALACNWQSGITLVGKFFVLSVSLSGSEVITLNAQGTALPQVTSSDEQDVSVPYYLTIFGANRCWRVHTADEIAFTAALVERGTYSATETYREGNIVTTADGARWIYTNPVASSGNAPPTLPTTSNAYWSNMTAASPVAVLGFLTNDTHVVNADASGAVTSWTGAGGTFVVQENGATLSSGVTFSLVSATGVTVSINATTGVYSATAMSASTGTATFRAVYNGVTIDKIFSIAKSITGATGATGSTGATGPTGPAATSAYLTRESAVLFAYADGSVASYSTATGDFKVFAGSTDISSNFTLSTVNNPQSLTVSYASQTFTISAGFDPGEDSATLTIRATGSGAYAGVTFDKVFTLTKAKGGYEIVGALPDTNLFEGRVVYLTTDDKLYRYTGAAWSKAVDGADIIANSILTNSIGAGQITGAKMAATSIITLTAQIDDGLITTAKIGDAQITNAKIGNLEVGTIKIADGAVTDVTQASNGSAITGNSTWKTVTTMNVVMSQGGDIIAIATLGQSFSSGAQPWSVRLLINGTVVYTASGTAFADSVSLSGKGAIASAGTIAVEIQWNSAASVSVPAGSGSLVAIRRYK